MYMQLQLLWATGYKSHSRVCKPRRPEKKDSNAVPLLAELKIQPAYIKHLYIVDVVIFQENKTSSLKMETSTPIIYSALDSIQLQCGQWTTGGKTYF